MTDAVHIYFLRGGGWTSRHHKMRHGVALSAEAALAQLRAGHSCYVEKAGAETVLAALKSDDEKRQAAGGQE